ncbi:MAG TPA: hypothetical protein P5013_07945, partial [Methanoregula sp.]|nr:hypothetical protein [Methanoregula sp.]
FSLRKSVFDFGVKIAYNPWEKYTSPYVLRDGFIFFVEFIGQTLPGALVTLCPSHRGRPPIAIITQEGF